jgi:hypothetical protein
VIGLFGHIWFFGNLFGILIVSGCWLRRNRRKYSRYLASERSDRLYLWALYVWMFSLMDGYLLIVYCIACLLLLFEVLNQRAVGNVSGNSLIASVMYIVLSVLYVVIPRSM